MTKPSSVELIIAGIIGLAGSLLAAHAAPSLAGEALQWVGGWLGSLLVIVGTGKLFFVDD